ncbi:tetratricopeptide repeat protein [Thalassotalea marina]|uniref:HcpA family protein n=1 Tax=Thalassotalea marina TaxID=1673741 RepID=A0A919BI60_9GAMM|nr:SEL1-like repeat protein [Thalassotalea marina]GHF92829.1 HcpA family protein [Thalassotalea marina]
MKKLIYSLLVTGCYIAYTPITFALNTNQEDQKNFAKQAEYSAHSAYKLGLAYLHGKDGVNKDLNEAVKLFERLVHELGFSEFSAKSAYILAVLNMGKYGHETNLKKSEKYFFIASKSSTEALYPDAPYHYAMLTHDDSEYIKSLEKSAFLGYVPAMLELANAHMKKERIKGNVNAMIRWLRMAADNDHVPAQALLGRMYFKGDHVYQDYKRAFTYLLKAAEQGNSDAQANLGLIYKLGLEHKVDFAKASHWFKESYRGGNLDAGENYAGILLDSVNHEEVKKGIDVLSDIAEQGSRSAAQKLIAIYQEGKLIEKNEQQLVYWQKLYAQTSDENSGIIGLNQSEQGEVVVFTTSVEAVELHKKGWEHFQKGKYQQAIPYLEQAAMLDLPVAQLDLGLAFIKKAQSENDSESYLKAFAWVKIAANNKQDQANVLLKNLEDSFDIRMLESALVQYKIIKGNLEDN